MTRLQRIEHEKGSRVDSLPKVPTGATTAPTDVPTSTVVGKWPAHCEQRAFVEGACWFQFKATGFTPWGSERDEAEDEAVRRYGEPASIIAAAPDLLAALKQLVSEVEAALPALNGACVMSAIHGSPYVGPTIDLPSAHAAIAKAEAGQ